MKDRIAGLLGLAGLILGSFAVLAWCIKFMVFLLSGNTVYFAAAIAIVLCIPVVFSVKKGDE